MKIPHLEITERFWKKTYIRYTPNQKNRIHKWLKGYKCEHYTQVVKSKKCQHYT